MKTLLITGVSSGLGRAMAMEALSRGHRVVGTLRDDDQARAFEATALGRSFGRILDVTDGAAMPVLVSSIEDGIGPIDVVINNAGYGLMGVVEELELDALRRQLEVNLIGPIALIQAVLPAMRKRRAGHIVNIASMGAMIAFAGLGAYHASKFAMLGLSDALAAEVGPLGIRVTTVLPGVYGSDWSGRSLARAPHRIADYDAALERRGNFRWGDAAALGRVVITAIEMEEPPAHLLVGPTALQRVRARLADWSEEIDRWESLSEADGEG